MVFGFLRRRRSEWERLFENPLWKVGMQRSVARRARPDASYARMGLVVRDRDGYHYFPRDLGYVYAMSVYAVKKYYGRYEIDALYGQPWGAVFWVDGYEFYPDRMVATPGFELATLRDLALYSRGYPGLRERVERKPVFKAAAVFSTSISDSVVPAQVLQAYAGRVEVRIDEGTRRRDLKLVAPVAELSWSPREGARVSRPRSQILLGVRGIEAKPALAPAVIDPLSLREPPRRLLGLRDAADYARYLAELHVAVLNTDLPNDEAGGFSRAVAAKAASAALERALDVARGGKREAVAEAVAGVLVDAGVERDRARSIGERFAELLERLLAKAASPPGEGRWAQEPGELFPVALVLRTALMETGRALGTGPSWESYISLRPKTLHLPGEVVEGLPVSRSVLALLARAKGKTPEQVLEELSKGGKEAREIATKAKAATAYRLALGIYKETGLALDPSEAAVLLHAALRGEEPEKALGLLGGGNGPKWFYAKNMAETVIASLGAPVYGFLANPYKGDDTDPGKAPMLASIYAEIAHSKAPREVKSQLLRVLTAVLARYADDVSRAIADMYMEDLEKRDPLGVMEEARFESPLTRALARAAVHVISDVDFTGKRYVERIWSHLDESPGSKTILDVADGEYPRINTEIARYFRGLAEKGEIEVDAARETRFFEALLARHVRQLPSPFYAELYTRVSEQALLGVAKYAENQNHLHSPYLYELPMDFLGYLKGAAQKAVARGIAETIASATMHLRGYREAKKILSGGEEGSEMDEVERAMLTGWIRDMPEIVANELREQITGVFKEAGVEVTKHPPVYSPDAVFLSPPERKAISLIKPYYEKAMTGLEAVELPVKVGKRVASIISAADGYMSLDVVKAFETLYWHSDEVYESIKGMMSGEGEGGEEETKPAQAKTLDVHEGA